MTDQKIITDEALDLLFRKARTYSAWQDKDVSDTLIQAVYELMKMAPTSANCSPARIVFVKSDEAKEKLKPHLAEGNVDKTMTAPVTAIVGHDMEFYNELPRLFPHIDAKSWFDKDEEKANETAFRNGTLQAGYLIIAARSLGLDCGPMSGFDADGVTKTFFADQPNVKADLLINLGYGDVDSLHERSPRLPFSDACKIL